LRNQTNMPQSVLNVNLERDTSYIEGPLGKSYLDPVPSVQYKRGDDNTTVTFAISYNLRPDSSLLGEQISSLRSYTALLYKWAADTSFFFQCDFTEATVKVNGEDVLVQQLQSRIELPDLQGKGLMTRVSLRYAKLPKE
jgi:hypothetical protein